MSIVVFLCKVCTEGVDLLNGEGLLVLIVENVVVCGEKGCYACNVWLRVGYVRGCILDLSRFNRFVQLHSA